MNRSLFNKTQNQQSKFQISEINSSDPDNIYLNLSIINNGNSISEVPFIPARFSQQFSPPLLQNGARKYELSIVRLSLTTGLLPIMIMPIQTGQNNPNLSVFSVSLSYSMYSAQQYVIWLPDSAYPVPAPPNGRNQDVSTGYYFLNSFEKFILMINTAFSACFTTLNGLVAGGLPVGSVAPYLNLNSDDTFSLVGQIANYDINVGTPIKVYMNQQLSQLFGGFPTNYLGVNAVNGLDVQYLIYNKHNNLYNEPSTFPVPTSAVFYNMKQEYPSLADITQLGVNKLVITTSMPIRAEQVPLTIPYGSDLNDNTVNNSQAVYQQILTDFLPPQGAELFNGSAIYLPSAQYRWCDIITSDSITDIDLNVYWSDAYNNLYPLQIPLNQQCSIKVLFKNKKDLI